MNEEIRSEVRKRVFYCKEKYFGDCRVEEVEND
jgi:hypothetical protein